MEIFENIFRIHNVYISNVVFKIYCSITFDRIKTIQQYQVNNRLIKYFLILFYLHVQIESKKESGTIVQGQAV